MIRRLRGWLVGPILVGIYRLALHASSLVKDEFRSVVGQEVADLWSPLFLLVAWVLFGYAVLFLFRER